MEVYFATKKLAETLSGDRQRVRSYGAVLAKKLGVRLAQMAAAETLEVLRWDQGGCHQLSGDRAGQLAMALTGNMRLVFVPRLVPPPTLEDGGLDWAAVSAITILEVTDYHGR